MTDVLLRQTPDGGSITVQAGLCLMSDGLETAVYTSLFGGNEDDPADSSGERQWWGNLSETDPDRTYRSETQFLLKSLPAVPASLLRIEQAVGRDLQWLIERGIVQSITVATSIPELNRVKIDIVLFTPRGPVPLSFG